MDGRLAVKVRDEKPIFTTGPWYDLVQNNLYRHSQPIPVKTPGKISNSVATEAKQCGDREETIFKGSLAEVYEKALTNVLNIQPSIKMEDNHSSKRTSTDSRPAETLDNRRSIPQEYSISGTYKHPEFRYHDRYVSQHDNNIVEGNKLSNTSKSAFHVPEKRRPINGLSRQSSWSHDYPFPCPVNYPGDYYPMMHPSAFYNRTSPYHNAFADRMHFYPGSRSRDYPVFTHVLPWTPFQRDYKPWHTPRFSEWRPKGNMGYELNRETKKASQDKPADKSTRSEGGSAVAQRLSSSREERPADTEVTKNPNHESEKVASDKTKPENETRTEISPTSHDYNVKTRRMRVFQKRNEFNKDGKKSSFDSPKEEFLFRLGLTRVH